MRPQADVQIGAVFMVGGGGLSVKFKVAMLALDTVIFGGFDEMLKLYYSPGACSLAPHIVLTEIGEPFGIELVSSMDGSTQTAEYLKLNPKGRVPALQIGDSILTEVSAIMSYLALTYPNAGLLSDTPIGRARTIEWMNWLTGIHATDIAQSWRTERFSDDTAVYAGIQAKGMKNLAKTCEQIDARLSQSTWAVGEQYSIADPYLLVFFRWGNRLGLDMSVYQHWVQHAKRMEQRGAVQVVLAVEEISIWS
uniref:Glutathione S-transferase (EC) n=1 Tax=uncultured Thiotrichaceae bacterium TaxID=298394 RepID=A0A6S6S3J1_9GAMM|nr:MAG: Glutathione S-transferase (EC [uncultured Thiotrichaceae bacterium]